MHSPITSLRSVENKHCNNCQSNRNGGQTITVDSDWIKYLALAMYSCMYIYIYIYIYIYNWFYHKRNT
ncbi:hypothetical protein Hanom_Chr01g00009831 [Helianthus anomalus]